MSATTITIEDDESGIRLDRWFKRHYPALGHGPLEKLLRTGQVRLDGKRVKAGDRVEPGQSIRLPPHLQTLQTENLKPRTEPKAESHDERKFIEQLVIHTDPALFVLNKPSGLPTQGGSGVRRHVDGLLAGLQGSKRQKPKLVHRLDRDTSGVLIVARTHPAAAALAESLRQRDAQKIYWALTVGVPQPYRGTIKLALAKETGFGQSGRDERMTTVDAATTGAKSAVTHYAVMGTAADKYAWVALKPITGRTHQLRAHLAAIGTPILGDFKYGDALAKGMGEIEDRLHLHARSIDIAHPDGGRLRVTAGLPAHMEKTWKLFGFDANSTEDLFFKDKPPPEQRPPEKKFEKKYPEKPYRENKSRDTRFEERPSQGKPFREKPSREKPSWEKRSGEKPFREKPFREKPFREKQSRDKPFIEKSFREKPAREKPSWEKRSGEKPFRGKPFRDKPFREKPFGEEPTREKPTREKPGREKLGRDKQELLDKKFRDKEFRDKKFRAKRYKDKQRHKGRR